MLAGEIEQIDFTKIKVSDKDYSLLSIEELQKLEELEEIKQETLVSEKVLLDDNTVNVHGIIYNTDLENSYYLRTIGLYANDPDEGEILYSITPASHADYVPTPNGNNITTLIIDLKTVISGAIVNLQGNPSACWYPARANRAGTGSCPHPPDAGHSGTAASNRTRPLSSSRSGCSSCRP